MEKLEKINLKGFLSGHQFLGFCLNIIGFALLFFQQIYLARLLPIEEFGKFNFISSIFAITGVFSTWGIGNLSTRRIPTFKSKEILFGFFTFSTIFIFLLNALIFLILSTLLDNLIELKNYSFVLDSLAFSSIYFFLKSIQEVYSVQLQANGYTIFSKLLAHTLPISISLLLLYFLFDFNPDIDQLPFLFIILSISIIATFIIILFNFKHEVISFFTSRRSYNVANWIKQGGSFMVLQFLYVVLGKGNVFLAGIYGLPKEVATYSVALSIANLVLFGLNSSNQILAPKISFAFSENKMKEFFRLIRIGSINGFISSLIFSVILIVFGKFVLNIFGLSYVDAYLFMVLLSIAYSFSAFCGPVGLTLTMTGKENLVIIATSIASFINICLSIILGYNFGVLGICLANCVALILLNLPLALYVRFGLGYNTMII